MGRFTKAEIDLSYFGDYPANVAQTHMEEADGEAAVDACVGRVYNSGKDWNSVINGDLNNGVKHARVPTLQCGAQMGRG